MNLYRFNYKSDSGISHVVTMIGTYESDSVLRISRARIEKGKGVISLKKVKEIYDL